MTNAQLLLNEFINLCAAGDVHETTEALGWGDLIKRAKSEIETNESTLIDIPLELDPSTKDLVIRFAAALANKLHKAEVKNGYSDEWLNVRWLDDCRRSLLEHVYKGDPIDVAAYCAFLWHHNSITTPIIEGLTEAADTVTCYVQPSKGFSLQASNLDFDIAQAPEVKNRIKEHGE